MPAPCKVSHPSQGPHHLLHQEQGVLEGVKGSSKVGEWVRQENSSEARDPEKQSACTNEPVCPGGFPADMVGLAEVVTGCGTFQKSSRGAWYSVYISCMPLPQKPTGWEMGAQSLMLMFSGLMLMINALKVRTQFSQDV